jgi:hypothetical protein
MPGVTLHMVLADRVLEHWEQNPRGAPFRPNDPGARNAFYQGAIGPDLGHFPGGCRFLSDLAHLVNCADLARTLVRRARTPVETAFAWGWVTHVLGDAGIHPLVGRGVGEVILGNRGVFVDGSYCEAAHVQVETGLDAYFSHRYPTVRHRAMAPVFDGASIRFLVDSFRLTYCLEFDPSLVLSSHLGTVRLSVQGLVSIGMMGSALFSEPVSLPSAGARWILQRALPRLRSWSGNDSLLMAYLTPRSPSPWLVKATTLVVHRFQDLFDHHYRTGLELLENVNLDTGKVDVHPVSHVRALQTTRRLCEMRGGIRVPKGGGAGFRPTTVPPPRGGGI